jgi:putative hydrolase of the HAD superfamily
LYRAAPPLNSSGIMSGMGLIPTGVRRVFFDAVGTLLFPHPPAGEAYHLAGRRFGSAVTLEEAYERFRDAFAGQDAIDLREGYRTSEDRERRRWRAIIADVLPDVSDPEGCFVHLWGHFADPANWRVSPDVGELFDILAARGVAVGIASNFDARLERLVASSPHLKPAPLVISSRVGWRKPSPQFFRRLSGWGDEPHQVLMVGDDRLNDYDGARAAGLHAALLDETTSLSDLIR